MTRVLPYSVRRVLSARFIRETEHYLSTVERQLNAAQSIASDYTAADLAWFRSVVRS